jgi:hypothetical protein
MGLALIIIGLLCWLLGFSLLGLILIILGVILLFAPGPWYGYSWYRRRGP